jgi:hypothetical protein
MPLNSSSAGQSFQDEIQAQIDRGTPLSNADMAKKLAQVYLEYSKGATVPGADMSAGGDVSILEDAFLVSDPASQVAKLAAGICNYWTTFATPGAPAHGGTAVVSVTVAGATMIPAMAAAIQSLVTDQEVSSPFVKFFQITETVVKTIPVTVVELIPGAPPTPTPFPEAIQ